MQFSLRSHLTRRRRQARAPHLPPRAGRVTGSP